MLYFLPTLIIYPFNVVTQILNLVFWASLIIITGLIKLIIPYAPARHTLTRLMNLYLSGFGKGCFWLLSLTNRLEWDIKIDGQLNKDGWYLIMANHLSWLDIMLLADFCSGRIPAPKFFIKQELIWMPFVGLGAWAMDMPFMKRYSSEFIAKHPHLKGKDIDTTRKACEKFRDIPTTMVNFVEGTRYSESKLKKRPSPFKHLMPPKAGGVAFTLATMGELFSNVLDITIAFPDNPGKVMHQALLGRLRRVVLDVKVMPVDSAMVGDYFNDDEFRQQFQGWLNQNWIQKDALLTSIKQG